MSAFIVACRQMEEPHNSNRCFTMVCDDSDSRFPGELAASPGGGLCTPEHERPGVLHGTGYRRCAHHELRHRVSCAARCHISARSCRADTECPAHRVVGKNQLLPLSLADAFLEP